MKRAILGALLGAGLVVVAVGLCGQRNEVFAQREAPYPATAAGGDLIAIPAGPVGGSSQMLTVIDPRQRVMSVYRIDGAQREDRAVERPQHPVGPANDRF